MPRGALDRPAATLARLASRGETLRVWLRARATTLRERPRRSTRVRRATGGWLIVLVLLVSGYFVPRGTSWNADTHIFLTASIVDRGTLNIDPLAPYTGDVAYANGHYFAEKAPGLSLAAIPVYVVLKYTLLGGQPYTALFAHPADQRTDFLPRYVLTLVLAGLPTGLLAALLAAFLARLGVGERWRVALALAYALGTMARAFAGQLFSHQLSALLIFSAFFVLYQLRQGERGARWAVAAGLLLGAAVLTEYPVALLAVPLAVYAWRAPGLGRPVLRGMALGAAPPLALAALYNWLAFGSPWTTGYARLAGPEQFRVGQAQGFYGITLPHLDALWQTTIGPYRGVFFQAPWLLLALPGFVWLWRRTAWRAETRLWLALVGLYGLFSVSYFAWDGGFSMGPRQFLPALPFLVLPVGEVVRSARTRAWRLGAALACAYAVVVVELSAATVALPDPRYDAPLTQLVLPRLVGRLPVATDPNGATHDLLGALWREAPLYLHARLENNWGMLFGLPGLLQLLPLVAACALVLWWGLRRPRGESRVGATGAPLAPR